MSKVEIDQAKDQSAAVRPEKKRRPYGSARGQIIISEDFDEPLDQAEFERGGGASPPGRGAVGSGGGQVGGSSSYISR